MSVPGGDGASPQSASDPKSFRQKLTANQRAILEAEYERNSEPGPQDRATIATRSGRSFTYVTRWFQDRRRRESYGSGAVNAISSGAFFPISPQTESKSFGLEDPGYVSGEEAILFSSILPILPRLHQLYLQTPVVSVERAKTWGAILGLEKLGAPPGIIEQWLDWRRMDEKETGKRFASPQNLPTQSTSAVPNTPHVPRTAQPSQTANGGEPAHLPTPSSVSPSPRASTLKCKDEPPSPVSGFPVPLPASPILPAPHGSQPPIAVPYPVDFAHPSGPLRRGSQQSQFSPNRQPPHVHPQSFAEFMRSQFATRADFNTAVEKMQVSDADDALEAFARIGKEAADAIAELSKILVPNP